MPTIRIKPTATTSDALQGVKFADIPAGGAILNGWFTGETAADAIGLSINNADILTPSTLVNVGSAQVVKKNEDQMVFNEFVGPGHLFMPVNAVTTSITAMLHLRYVGS